MRNLLGVQTTDRNAVFGARKSTTTSIVLAGIRCILTYLVLPILAPAVGFLGTLGTGAGIALSGLAIGTGVLGVRRFWIADHRARWPFTWFIGTTVVLLAVAIGIDLAALA